MCMKLRIFFLLVSILFLTVAGWAENPLVSDSCTVDTIQEKKTDFRKKVKRTGSLIYRFVKGFDEYDK